MNSIALDAAGHRRSPATMPDYHQRRQPRNKGLRHPADPPMIEEIVAVMRVAGDRLDGLRLRALTVLLWRAGLRNQRSARPRGDRPGPLTRRGTSPPWEGREAALGRDGPLGLAATRSVA